MPSSLSIDELQSRIDDNGYQIRLISSNGTQQTDENDIICLGCNASYTVTGNLLFRKPIQSSFPGCSHCQIVERAEKQQQRLDEMGKRVDIIVMLAEGSTSTHKLGQMRGLWWRPYPVNGRKLTRRGKTVGPAIRRRDANRAVKDGRGACTRSAGPPPWRQVR